MTTPPSALPPANWYPDPQTPGQLRYWDGQRWTPHVHPIEQPAQATGGFVAQVPQTANDQTAQGSPARTYAPVIQASPVTVARPQSTPGIQATGPVTAGVFTPVAQPATGGLFPATGATPTQPATGGLFPATGASPIQPGTAVAGTLQVPKPRDLDDDDSGDQTPTAGLAAISAVLGIAALGVAALAIFGLGAGFDEYLPYAAAGLGFVAILLGFIGMKRASAGFMGGKGFAWSGIVVGFLSILISTYEYLYPGELYDIYTDYLGG